MRCKKEEEVSVSNEDDVEEEVEWEEVQPIDEDDSSDDNDDI